MPVIRRDARRPNESDKAYLRRMIRYNESVQKAEDSLRKTRKAIEKQLKS